MPNQILNGESSSQSTKQSIFSVDCDTIDSGLGILNNFLSKKINLSHCSAIIFSEDFAKDGINKQINTFINNIEIRPNSNIIISNKSALDVLENISNSGENFSSRYYEFLINSSSYTGYSSISKLNDFFFSINSLNTEATANYVTINDNIVQNNGIAVFKDDCFVGTLEPLDTICHFIILNNFRPAIISINDPFQNDKIMDINLLESRSYTDVSIINNTPYIKIHVNASGKIKSSNSNFDYSSDESIRIVEDSLNRYLEKNIEKYLYKISRDYNSDICFLGEKLSVKYLTDDSFKLIHWNEIFKDSVFDVSVISDINFSYLYNKETR